jgi:hypothetical protein
LLFQPSHKLLVLASPLTVASCTFQMAGRNIGGLRLKTRRTAVQTIITDFEDAVLRAATAVFGCHINHQGCFYHLTQASWRRIQHILAVVVMQELLVVGSCCILFRQSDICICGWEWRSWTLVSNCAFAVFFLWLFFLHSHKYLYTTDKLFISGEIFSNDPVPCSIDDLSVTEIRDELKKK